MFERNVIIADFDQHKLARARKNKARVASRSASYIGCFHQDAMVSTTRGRVAVKDLCETDRVFTRDNGFQPIKFLGQQHSSGEQTVASVKIAAHAIAPSMPSVDVVLSSDQHVLLVTPSQSDFGSEQLVPCQDLLATTTGLASQGSETCDYIVALERDEIILVDGLWVSTSLVMREMEEPLLYRASNSTMVDVEQTGVVGARPLTLKGTE